MHKKERPDQRREASVVIAAPKTDSSKIGNGVGDTLV